MINLICEVCYNHGGDIKQAKKIVNAFLDSCDIFKFQKMHPKTFLKKRYYEKNKNHIDYFGKTYGEHRDHLELTIEEHKELKRYIESKGKKYSCSVHDIHSAKEIIPLDPEYIKIASCNCNNFKLIDYCLKNFKGLIHISTGMTTKKERQKLLCYSNNIVPYSCTSDYTGKGDIYIERMRGFSCHVPNILYAIAAITNGAKYIEYHCTIDRKIKGVGQDPQISLMPDDYMDLREWIDGNSEGLGKMKFKKPPGVPEMERAARNKLWSTA